MSVLDDAELQALHEALDDEYRAWAAYDQVIRDFGPERPFINIREAEARHIEALRLLFRRYDLEVPQNPWPARSHVSRARARLARPTSRRRWRTAPSTSA